MGLHELRHTTQEPSLVRKPEPETPTNRPALTPRAWRRGGNASKNRAWRWLRAVVVGVIVGGLVGRYDTGLSESVRDGVALACTVAAMVALQRLERKRCATR
jgi:hypothetical protein